MGKISSNDNNQAKYETVNIQYGLEASPVLSKRDNSPRTRRSEGKISIGSETTRMTSLTKVLFSLKKIQDSHRIESLGACMKH